MRRTEKGKGRIRFARTQCRAIYIQAFSEIGDSSLPSKTDSNKKDIKTRKRRVDSNHTHWK